MAHVCGYCSACLNKLTLSGVEQRAAGGIGQCCNCQQRSQLYGVLATDVSTTATAVKSDKKYGPTGAAHRT